MPSCKIPWLRIRWASSLAVLSMTLGCGGQEELAPASGKVLYKGKPLAFGSVMFQHASGGQPSQGEIQPDGTFEMSTFDANDGARIGPNLVSIFCYESQDPARKAQRSAGEQSLGRLLIPRKYTLFSSSGLRVDVSPEKNDPFVFELQD
jgi:hypothetical protein